LLLLLLLLVLLLDFAIATTFCRVVRGFVDTASTFPSAGATMDLIGADFIPAVSA
jgi:hypothetical protein